MKITRVTITPEMYVQATGISCNKTISATGKSIEDVSKQLMKKDFYFTRDTEIAEDIHRVLEEQQDDNLRGIPEQKAA